MVEGTGIERFVDLILLDLVRPVSLLNVRSLADSWMCTSWIVEGQRMEVKRAGHTVEITVADKSGSFVYPEVVAEDHWHIQMGKRVQTAIE